MFFSLLSLEQLTSFLGEWAIKVLQAEGARHRQADNTSPKVARVENQDPDPLGYRGAPHIDGKPAEGFVEPAAVVEKDYGSYRCRGGRLVISSAGVRFDPALGRRGHWALRYQDVKKLEKVSPVSPQYVSSKFHTYIGTDMPKSTRHVQKTIGKDSGDDMRLVGPDGVEYVVSSMEKRDECFSQIVGYSDVTWQIVW